MDFHFTTDTELIELAEAIAAEQANRLRYRRRMKGAYRDMDLELLKREAAKLEAMHTRSWRDEGALEAIYAAMARHA